MSTARVAFAARVLACLSFLTPSLAWALKTGDIIVADRTAGLIYVDASTGTQHLLTAPNGSQGFTDVTTDASGNIFAIDGTSYVYKIDNMTGIRTVVTFAGHLLFAQTIDLAPDGNLYVVEGSGDQGVIKVDPGTGTQTLVTSGLIQAFAVNSTGVGYIALDDTSTVPNFHVYSVDLTNGQKVRVANGGFYDPRGLAADAAGNLIITESGSKTAASVQKIYASFGAVALVSSGGQFMTPWGVTVEGSGMIIMADNQNLLSCHPFPPAPNTCPGALFRVDPASGTQVTVSEKGLFENVAGVDIYRGPNVTTPARTTSWGRIKTIYR
jgi:hypothetical protein